MVGGPAAAAGRFDHQAELVLDPLLSDEFPEVARAQCALDRTVVRLRLRLDQVVGREVVVGVLGRRHGRSRLRRADLSNVPTAGSAPSAEAASASTRTAATAASASVAPQPSPSRAACTWRPSGLVRRRGTVGGG